MFTYLYDIVVTPSVALVTPKPKQRFPRAYREALVGDWTTKSKNPLGAPRQHTEYFSLSGFQRESKKFCTGTSLTARTWPQVNITRVQTLAM